MATPATNVAALTPTPAPAPAVPAATGPDIVVYKLKSDVTVTVIDGQPPSDQAAEVTSLKTQLADMTTDRDKQHAKIAALTALADQFAAIIKA